MGERCGARFVKCADILVGMCGCLYPSRGVVICGSGVGAAIAANKYPGVRAGLCHDTYSAGQGVRHDDMNVLCLGARVVGVALAEDLVKSFMAANLEANEPRFQRRLDKVTSIENEQISRG